MSNHRPMNSDPLPISDRAFSFIRQFLATMLLHRQAYYFIRKYRPWDGLPQYGWVLKTMIVIGVIVGWQIFSGFYKTLSQVVTDPLSFGASVSAAFANPNPSCFCAGMWGKWQITPLILAYCNGLFKLPEILA